VKDIENRPIWCSSQGLCVYVCLWGGGSVGRQLYKHLSCQKKKLSPPPAYKSLEGRRKSPLIWPKLAAFGDFCQQQLIAMCAGEAPFQPDFSWSKVLFVQNIDIFRFHFASWSVSLLFLFFYFLFFPPVQHILLINFWFLSFFVAFFVCLLSRFLLAHKSWFCFLFYFVLCPSLASFIAIFRWKVGKCRKKGGGG